MIEMLFVLALVSLVLAHICPVPGCCGRENARYPRGTKTGGPQ